MSKLTVFAGLLIAVLSVPAQAGSVSILNKTNCVCTGDFPPYTCTNQPGKAGNIYGSTAEQGQSHRSPDPVSLNGTATAEIYNTNYATAYDSRQFPFSLMGASTGDAQPYYAVTKDVMGDGSWYADAISKTKPANC